MADPNAGAVIILQASIGEGQAELRDRMMTALPSASLATRHGSDHSPRSLLLPDFLAGTVACQPARGSFCVCAKPMSDQAVGQGSRLAARAYRKGTPPCAVGEHERNLDVAIGKPFGTVTALKKGSSTRHWNAAAECPTN